MPELGCMNILGESLWTLVFCSGRMPVSDVQAGGDIVPLSMLPLKNVDRKRAVCLQRKERSLEDWSLGDSKWFGVSVLLHVDSLVTSLS